MNEMVLATESALPEVPDATPRRYREQWERDHVEEGCHVEASALGVGDLELVLASSTPKAHGVCDSETPRSCDSEFVGDSEIPSQIPRARAVCDSELVLASSSTPRSPAGDTDTEDTESGWEDACSQLVCAAQERATNHAASSHAGSSLGGSARRTQTYSGDSLSRSLLTSPTTTRSFSSTRTFSTSLSSADSLDASPTIPSAVTPSRAPPRSCFQKRPCTVQKRPTKETHTDTEVVIPSRAPPRSALRGRFTTPGTKKISFDLSTPVGGESRSAGGEGRSAGGGGASGGSGDPWEGHDDWLSDAQEAAAVLATPRTPKGSRGVACQMSNDGFKTAVKPGAAQQRMGFVTPTPKTVSRTAATPCKTPLSAVAFRRRRDGLVQGLVQEFNSTVFGGCLPADLEVTYTYMYVCMYVCMYLCMHVCIYVCMYMCMCIYIYR